MFKHLLKASWAHSAPTMLLTAVKAHRRAAGCTRTPRAALQMRSVGLRWQSGGAGGTTTTTTGTRRPVTAAAIGVTAGGLGSLVGMGGGFVAIPLLTSRLVGMGQHQAHATSVAAVLACGAAGAASFATAGSVDWYVNASN